MRKRWLVRLMLGFITAGVAAVLALWLEHRLATELPVPTGPFALGRASFTWDDIGLWVWYPCRRCGAGR